MVPSHRAARATALAFALALLAALPALAAPDPVRVLLLGGLNTHEGQDASGEGRTTRLIRRILEESGRFTVDVTIDPAALRPETLEPYAAVIDNWSNYPAAEHPWGAEAETALLDFVRGGGGFAVIHASTACFPTWPEYRDLIGLYWEEGTAGHAAVHAFTVQPARQGHPITRGMQPFEITDELYQRLTLGPRARVVSTAFSDPAHGGTGGEEPMAAVTEFGEGRCFTIVLGHDDRALDSDGWRLLFTRGLEWAATERATVERPLDPEAALRAIATHRSADARERLASVERLVRDAIDDPGRAPGLANAMAAFLATDATVEAKSFVLRQLSLLATSSQVPAIAVLLGGESLGRDALDALRRIGSPAATAALRKALPRLRGKHLAGAVGALGALGDRAAVRPLAELLESPDREVALAAIDALGRIADTPSIDALSAFLPSAREALRGPIADALLRCADSVRARGDLTRARALYQACWERDTPPESRAAAYAGLLALAPSLDLILQGFTGRSPRLSSFAAAALTDPRNKTVVESVAPGIARLDPASQVQVLAALARLGDPAYATYVTPLLAAPRAEVRRAAMDAVAELGGADEVPPLVDALRAGADDAERAHGGEALARLLTRIDRAGGGLPLGFAEIGQEPAAVQAALLRAISRVGSREALAVLRDALAAPAAELRLAALNALAGWPDRQPVGALLERARLAGAGPEREAALGVIASLALRGPREPAKSASLLAAALPLAGGAEAKRALLGALGLAPVAESLPAVLPYLDDADAGEEAALAVVRIAGALDASQTEAVTESLRAVLAAARSGPAHDAARDALLRLGVDLPRTPSARLAEPGPDLARDASATSPDGIDSDGAASGDQAAIDGDPATYWDEADNQAEYRLLVTFPSEREVGAIRITGHQHHSYAPRDFAVLCDGAVVAEVVEAAYEANVFALTFPAVRCTTLELRITGYHGRSPAIRELEVFGPQAR